MRKTVFLLLIFTAAFSISVFGSTEKFNDWVYDKDTLVLDNLTFKFKLSQSATALTAETGSISYIISLSQCKESSLFEICFLDSYDDTLYDEKRAKVKISFKQPNITIERSLSAQTVEAGDKITFSLKVINSGDMDASDVRYVDYFPGEVLIGTIGSPCKIGENNSVVYYGSLKKSSSFSCTYAVMPKKELDIKLKAQLDYSDAFSQKKIYSSLLALKATPIFQAKIYQVVTEGNETNTTERYVELDDAYLEAGKEFRLIINLSGIVEKELYFKNFTIIIPQEFIVEKANTDGKNTIYRWTGRLEPNETRQFFFILTPSSGGNFEIRYAGDVEKDKKALGIIDGKQDFKVASGDLLLTSTLDNATKFDSGKEMYVAFWAQNTYNHTDIIEGVASVSGTLLSQVNVPIGMIKSNKTIVIYKTTLLPANVSSSQTHKFTVEANYTTAYGIKKTAKKEWSITLKPLLGIDITRTINPSSITEGDDVNITVKVKNTQSRPVYDVKLQEIIPEEFSRSGKTRFEAGILMPDEEVEAYNYTLKAPKVKNETKLTLSTNISYRDETAELQKEEKNAITVLDLVNITIKPKKISLSITKTADSAAIDLGEFSKISYTIENKDTETAYKIAFLFSASADVDVINDYQYYLERLEPGEIVTFKREVLRPKKAGKYRAGATTVFFEDADKNLFNNTVDTVVFDVQNRTISGPALILSKKVLPLSPEEGGNITITLTLNNLGDEAAMAKVEDEGKTFFQNVPAKKETNITYTIKAEKDHNTTTDAFAYYKYHGDEYRAHAQGQAISVKAKEVPKEAADAAVVQGSGEETSPAKEDDLKQKNGFFARIIIKIKSFFGK